MGKGSLDHCPLTTQMQVITTIQEYEYVDFLLVNPELQQPSA